MASLRQFQLYLTATGLRSITKTGLYYNELLNNILSPRGAAPASSFKMTEYDDNQLSYDVTIDTDRYPNLTDYAKNIYGSLEKALTDRSIKYEVFRTTENPRDVIYFTLEYKRKKEDFEKDLLAAKIKATAKEKRDEEYNRLLKEYTKAEKSGDQDAMKKAKDRLDALEGGQEIQVTPVSSAAESELEKKALAVEQPKPEEPKIESPKPAEQKQMVPPPVIVTPAEKTTVLGAENKTSEKTFIESVSSTVFDKKILEYEKSSIERERSEASKESSSTTKAYEKTQQGGMVSESMLLKDSMLAKEIAPIVASQLQKSITQTIIPSDVSKIVSTIIASESMKAESTESGKQSAVSVANQTNQIKDVVSSIKDAVSIIQDTASTSSEILQEATTRSELAFNNASAEASKLVDVAAERTNATAEKLSESLVTTEKTSTYNQVLSDMERKVTSMELPQQMSKKVDDITTGITNALKNVVTNITQMNKTANVEAASTQKQSQSSPVASPTTIGKGETTTNLGTQTNQVLSGGQNVFPSVVSLSQSTIDNLASAIIKNMSISPFLNSGR